MLYMIFNTALYYRRPATRHLICLVLSTWLVRLGPFAFFVIQPFPVVRHGIHIIRSFTEPILRVAKVLPHGLEQRTIRRAVPETLHDVGNALRFVDVGEAGRVVVGPLCKLVPAPAHARLAESRGNIGLHGRVEGRVVGFADDVLHEVVHAVDKMCVRVHLWAAVIVEDNGAADLALQVLGRLCQQRCSRSG